VFELLSCPVCAIQGNHSFNQPKTGKYRYNNILWNFLNTFFTNLLYFICMYCAELDSNICMKAPERSSDYWIFSCDSQRLPCLQRSVATSVDACQETCNYFVGFNIYLPCCHVERRNFQLVISELDYA